jgi:divalent metal cation (Fe/Co/Zn/Cd) transporter
VLLLLLQDHLNDILSNLCAIITAVLAGVVANGWWVDPVGAVAISLYIVARWLAIAKQQVGVHCTELVAIRHLHWIVVAV